VVESVDDVKVTNAGIRRRLLDDPEVESSAIPVVPPATDGEVMKHPACPGLRIVESADPSPFPPNAQQDLLDEVARLLDIAREQEGLLHQRVLCELEEAFVFASRDQVSQSVLLALLHFIPPNTREETKVLH
jgi:hypothetical protein